MELSTSRMVRFEPVDLNIKIQSREDLAALKRLIGNECQFFERLKRHRRVTLQAPIGPDAEYAQDVAWRLHNILETIPCE